MQQWLNKLKTTKLERFAPLIFLLLLIWLAWRIANLFWWFMAPPQPPTVQQVVMGAQQKTMPDIVRFSLFEEQGVNPQAQQENLPIKLEGVMLARPNYLSSAVIRLNNQATSYRVGTTIEGTSLTLTEVSWDRIVVREGNGSTREVLLGDASFSLNNMDTNVDSNSANHIAAPNQNNVPPFVPPVSTPQNAIGNAIEQIQNDREGYLNQMGVAATGGGFEISERTPPALRARLGLKPGDRIVSVNGQSVGAGMNEAQLLEQMKKSGQAKIEIQRGEQTLTIQQSF